MHKLVIVAILIGTISSPAIAQQASSAPKTKLEAFTGRTGAAFIKGYTKIGAIKARGNIEVTALTFRNAQSGQEQAGIIVEIAELGRSSYTQGARSFLDYEEIPGLLEGIDYILATSSTVTEHPFFEARYSTKGDFNVIVFNDGTERRNASVSSGNIGAQTAFVTLDELAQFRQLIVKARATIDDHAAARAAAKAAATVKAREQADQQAQERATRAAAEQASRELLQRSAAPPLTKPPVRKPTQQPAPPLHLN